MRMMVQRGENRGERNSRQGDYRSEKCKVRAPSAFR